MPFSSIYPLLSFYSERRRCNQMGKVPCVCGKQPTADQPNYNAYSFVYDEAKQTSMEIPFETGRLPRRERVWLKSY